MSPVVANVLDASEQWVAFLPISPADFRNLIFGSGEVTISSALKALEDYFLPKRNVVYVNYVFNSCCQTPDKLIDRLVIGIQD